MSTLEREVGGRAGTADDAVEVEVHGTDDATGLLQLNGAVPVAGAAPLQGAAGQLQRLGDGEAEVGGIQLERSARLHGGGTAGGPKGGIALHAQGARSDEGFARVVVVAAQREGA